MATSSIYGTGIAFPFRFDSAGVRIESSSGEDLIMASIDQIINTDVDERPFLYKDGIRYGTRLRRAIFQPSGVFVDIFRYDVPLALSVWEPRINVLEVDAYADDVNPSYVVGNVTFRYVATNRVDNYVRPYRLNKPDTQR